MKRNGSAYAYDIYTTSSTWYEDDDLGPKNSMTMSKTRKWSSRARIRERTRVKPVLLQNPVHDVHIRR
jgi:hypothetical protein